MKQFIEDVIEQRPDIVYLVLVSAFLGSAMILSIYPNTIVDLIVNLLK